MRSKWILYIVIFFVSLSTIIFAYNVFEPLFNASITLSNLLYSIGKFLGLCGFLLLSILIISGDSARFFDKYFGMDKIIKFQRRLATIVTIYILLHPTFFILSNRIYLEYLLPQFSMISLALGTMALYILIVITIASKLYKLISDNVWQYLHILTYILFAFALYHALNIGSDTDNIFVRAVILVLFISLLISVAYRTYYKIKNRNLRCFVKEVKWETHDTFTLKLKPNRKFEFKAGQFCFLRIKKDRLYARHPFTISSAPHEATLDFTIKNTGRFTASASQLKIGEEVSIDGPFGIFTVKEPKNLVFIAGGVGITPFMSILKDQVHKNSRQSVLLLYGSRTHKDIIYHEELDSIHMDSLKIIYALSREQKNGFDKGHIDKEMVKKHLNSIENTAFYICGPKEMQKAVLKALKELNVQKCDIHVEDFFW